MKNLDLFVIGGGSGGIRAARLAAALGKRVGLAEEYRLGGTCVIRGCVPKKLMVYAAGFSEGFEDCRAFGWSANSNGFHLDRFKEAKDQEISRLESIYRKNLLASGTQLFESRAIVRDRNLVELENGERIGADCILVATGGAPFIPEFPGFNHAITSNDVFHMSELPSRLLVVGGGYIACEFACIFNGLGSQVTQWYRGEQILRGFDADIRNNLYDAMLLRGMDVKLNTTIESIEKTSAGLQAVSSNGDKHEFDAVLVATGRRPNTAGLGLADVGVELDPLGAVRVDSYSRSSVESIYALGDVTNRVNLTPVAIRDAVAFVETKYRKNPSSVDHDLVPTAIFTRPEIGTVGMSEENAEHAASINVYETKFRPLANTLAGRDEYSYMKMITEKTSERIMGLHIVGPGAAEMIQLAGVAVKMGARKDDFDRTVAVHPTAAEELVTFGEPVRSS